MRWIRDAINKKEGRNFRAVHDGYIGATFYDANRWELTGQCITQRTNSLKACLTVQLSNNRNKIVVSNIHLKARLGELQKTARHASELRKVIDHVFESFPAADHFYVAGDFNNDRTGNVLKEACQ